MAKPQRKASGARAEGGHYADEQTIAMLVDRCKQDAQDNGTRRLRDQADLLGLMFYRGGPDNQWVVWDHSAERYVPNPTEGEGAIPSWVPRCTINHFAKQIDGIVSLLNQSSPARTPAPRTSDDEDLATADVAESALPVLEAEIGYDALKRRIHQLITLTNAVAVVYYFDNDAKYGTEDIPYLQCQECGQLTTPMEAASGPSDAEAATNQTEARCPGCGGAVDIATDPETGQTRGKSYPKGKLSADIWSSFEYSIPSGTRVLDAEQMPWVFGHVRMAVEEACRAWPKHKAAILEQAGHAETGLGEQYAEAMRELSSPQGSGPWGFAGGSPSSRTVSVYRLLHDPLKDDEFDFPEGLYAVQVGDLVVESGPLPLTDDDGRRKKPVIFRQFADTPGSPYGKPPADDLIPLQRELNLTDTLIFLILMHHASPTTWVPSGVTLEDDISGMPGLVHRYTSLQPGERPFTERGVNPPEGLYKWREVIVSDMDRMSGLNAILQGQQPEGSTTATEIERLREQGQAQFRTPLDLLIEFERRQSLMLLQLARQTAWAPRFSRVMGENGQWEISQFTSADLGGRIDIDIEPMSAWPKSPSMQQQRLRQGLEIGLVQPQADPEIAVKLLEWLDLTDFKPSVSIDEQQIARELDRWKAATSPADIWPPKPEPLINVPMHLASKIRFLKSETAERLAQANPKVFTAMLRHVTELQQRLQMAQMAQAGPQAGAVGPGAGARDQPAPPGPSAAPPPPGPGATAPGGPEAGQAPPPEPGPTGPSADELRAAEENGGGMAGPMAGPARLTDVNGATYG